MNRISEYYGTTLAHNHIIYTNPKDSDFQSHTHDLSEIIFVKKGDISAIIGEKTYKLTKGSLVIFRKTVPHRIKVDSAKDYERHNIVFDENILANGIFKKFPEEREIINYTSDSHVAKLFEKFDYYYERLSQADFALMVENLIEEILFNLYLEPDEKFAMPMFSVHPVIDTAISYINEHYTEPITIEDICQKACVTQSHLHHLFMENLKISPKKYINMKRVTKALMLINMGEKPTDVYIQCGFTDYVTFFRNFTSYFGFSPSNTQKHMTERTILI